MFPDKSRFSNFGMLTLQNIRYWARENQRLVREGALQEFWSYLMSCKAKHYWPILFPYAINWSHLFRIS